MKSLVTIIGLACAGIVLAGAAAGSERRASASPRCVSFLATYTLSPDGRSSAGGRYTRIGSIPAGRLTDGAELVSEQPFRVRVERTLDPGKKGGATIRMRLNGLGTAANVGSPPHNEARGTWAIVSGTGRYASLTGKGNFVALAIPGPRGFAAHEALVGCIAA